MGKLLSQCPRQCTEQNAVTDDNDAGIVGIRRKRKRFREDRPEMVIQEEVCPRPHGFRCFGIDLRRPRHSGCRGRGMLDALPVPEMLLSKLGHGDGAQHMASWAVAVVARVAYGLCRLCGPLKWRGEDVADVELRLDESRRQTLGLEHSVGRQRGIARAAVQTGNVVYTLGVADEKKVHWPEERASHDMPAQHVALLDEVSD